MGRFGNEILFGEANWSSRSLGAAQKYVHILARAPDGQRQGAATQAMRAQARQNRDLANFEIVLP
jgi:hypothetical protein